MRLPACLTLECLLVVASFNEHVLAARPKWQRAAPLPDVLPPGPFIDDGQRSNTQNRELGELDFTLRHIYLRGSPQHPDLHLYKDIPPDTQLVVTDDYGRPYENAPRTLKAKVVVANAQRLVDRRRTAVDMLLDYAYAHGRPADLPSSAWTIDEIKGPNYTDKETVLSMAKMSANAYIEDHDDSGWYPVGGGFNYTDHFGWRSQGLRGHIFADPKNETVVIALKGTSPALFDGADTTGNDKLNDNLFGSCCCGQGGQFMWKQVCDCMTSAYTCNQTCLVKSLREKSHYYWAVRDLYHNVTERYPEADVWLAGHSLGGVVNSLLALTYGLPAFTFEAYPDALAASRLGLPTPPGYRIGAHQSRDLVNIHHFGHTADPIFMGTCNTAASACTLGGYAFQGVCHTGKTCLYDTMSDFHWRQGVGSHTIKSVINDVISQYDHVPTCEEDTDCSDCFNWKFYESNGTETTTTKSTATSTSASRTRTETCKTPGWWGCLDESTTTTSTTTYTSTFTETTCLTPGWFGCNDGSTTITSTTTVTSPSREIPPTPTKSVSSPSPSPTVTRTSSTGSQTIPTSSSTCRTPGWFGCKDLIKTTSTTTRTTSSSTITHHTSTTCSSWEWFGLICVDPSPTATPKPTPTTTARPTHTSHAPKRRKKCRRRNWFGFCKDWEWHEGL